VSFDQNLTFIADEAFSCSGIKSFNGSNVMGLGKRAFYDCESLCNICLPNIRIVNESSFELCTGLKELKPIYMPNVERIEKFAFAFCVCLKIPIERLPDESTINFFKNITYVGRNAFQYCYGIDSVYFESVVTIKEYAFSHCNNANIFDNTHSFVEIENFAFEYTKTTDLYFTKLKTFNQNFLVNCNQLNSVEINCSYDTIFPYGFLSKLPALERVEIIFLTKCSSKIDHFCVDCSKLKKLKIKNLTSIGNSFCENCNSLFSLEINQVEIIGDKFLHGCYSL